MLKKTLLLGFTALLFASCSQEQAQQPGFEFKGKVEGLENDRLFLYNDISSDTIFTDSLGNFSFSKKIDKAELYTLANKRKRIQLWAKNGIELQFYSSSNNFMKDAVFSGEGSDQNNILADMARSKKEMGYYPGFFKLEPEQFLQKCDSVTDVLAQFAENYAKSENPDQDFLSVLNENNKYEKIYYYNKYPSYHRYLAKEDASLPEDIHHIIKNSAIDSDSLINSTEYIRFMTEFMEKQFEASAETEPEDYAGYTLQYMEWLNENVKAEQLKNILLFKAVRNTITYVSEEQRDALYNYYSELNSDNEFKKVIDGTYLAFEELRKGKAAPKWAYPDIDGNMYALDDFKGKYVYVDIWATWCSPCRAEIPALAELAENYKDQDIAFVSVSIDDSKRAWESMIKKENFQWTQIYAKEAWQSDIVTKNLIKGIPRFLLIDREGNFVTSNAPNPSSEEIKILIDDLLKG